MFFSPAASLARNAVRLAHDAASFVRNIASVVRNAINFAHKVARVVRNPASVAHNAVGVAHKLASADARAGGATPLLSVKTST